MQETEIKVNESNDEKPKLSPEELEKKVRATFKTLEVVDAWQALKTLVDDGKQPEFAKCDGKYVCQTDEGCFEGDSMEEAVARAAGKAEA